jgi:hypothetical protein
MSSIAERILDCFPSGTYALHTLLGLLEIVETTETETAAVECRAQPRMLVNPEFVERHAATPEKLLMLVMHELHHVLLGHTRLFPRVTAVDNLVFDAIINSLLCRMFPEPEHTRFFTDFYNEKAFPACLLRPPQGWNPGAKTHLPRGLFGPRYAPVQDVYRALYSEKGAGYDDLYHALRKLVDEQDAAAVPLIGDHCGKALPQLEESAPVLFDAVRQIVEKWPRPPDPIAGRSMAQLLRQSQLRPVRRLSGRELLRKLLRRVGGRQSGNGQTRLIDEDRIVIDTPLPAFDRRYAVLTALGARPILFPARVAIRRPRLGGERVHVYLDVSGSIGSLKGPLYGAVLDCREFVHSRIHLFSTEVADITLDELPRGVCRTTGGTDIGCVASHMRANRVRRAAIITDGFTGKPAGQDFETLKRARVGIALTPGYSSRVDLEVVADWIVEIPRMEG